MFAGKTSQGNRYSGTSYGGHALHDHVTRTKAKNYEMSIRPRKMCLATETYEDNEHTKNLEHEPSVAGDTGVVLE
jgi:hypothetical protein